MIINTESKIVIMDKFKRSKNDTGSPEVQIALLTKRINELTVHFKIHKKDNHGRRSLVRIVNSRRRILDYLKRKDVTRYSNLISHLGLRR